MSAHFVTIPAMRATAGFETTPFLRGHPPQATVLCGVWNHYAPSLALRSFEERH